MLKSVVFIIIQVNWSSKTIASLATTYNCDSHNRDTKNDCFQIEDMIGGQKYLILWNSCNYVTKELDHCSVKTN